MQRVPVRIAIDPKQLAEHPLRIGLSMKAEVSLRDQKGEVLPSAPAKGTVFDTDVYAKQLHGCRRGDPHDHPGQPAAATGKVG